MKNLEEIMNEEVTTPVELYDEEQAIVDTEDYFSTMVEDLEEFEEMAWN